MCDNILAYLPSIYTIATILALFANPAYDPDANKPWWERAYKWFFSKNPWARFARIAAGVELLAAAIAITLVTYGATSAAIGPIVGLLIGFTVGVVTNVLVSVVTALSKGSSLSDALINGLADGIFWGGVFAFVTASVNAIKVGVRSIQKAKLASSSQGGSQPCSKIHGKAHGSAEHQARIMEEVGNMVDSGEYSDIFLNRSLHTTGVKNGNYLRPDIIGVKNGGGFKIIEVASKSQASGRALNILKNHVNIYKNIVGSLNVKFIPWGY